MVWAGAARGCHRQPCPALVACTPSAGPGRQRPRNWPRSSGSAQESGGAPERGEGAGDDGIGAPDALCRLTPRRRASPLGRPSRLCVPPTRAHLPPPLLRRVPCPGPGPRPGAPRRERTPSPVPALLRPSALRTAPPPRGGRGGDTYGVGGPTAAGAPRGAPWASLEGLSAAAQPAAPAHLLAAFRTEVSRGRCASGAGTVRAAGRLAGSPPLASPSPHTAALRLRRAGHLQEEGAARAARSPSAGGAGRSGGTGALERPGRFVSIENDLLVSERQAPAI